MRPLKVSNFEKMESLDDTRATVLYSCRKHALGTLSSFLNQRKDKIKQGKIDFFVLKISLQCYIFLESAWKMLHFGILDWVCITPVWAKHLSQVSWLHRFDQCGITSNNSVDVHNQLIDIGIYPMGHWTRVYSKVIQIHLNCIINSFKYLTYNWKRWWSF